MNKVTIPRRRAVSSEFSAALTALCRAKGLDIKLAWPLADAKRLAADEAKKFEDARADAIERHGLSGNALSEADRVEANRKFAKEVIALLDAPVTFGIEAASVAVDAGSLTGDVLEQVMEFVKRPE